MSKIQKRSALQVAFVLYYKKKSLIIFLINIFYKIQISGIILLSLLGGVIIQELSKVYIGRNIKIKIDRPLNSKHSKYDFVYEVNYGYVPDTVSGDGEEIDAYVLGIKEPLEEFEGKCIAIIHRINDDDDKLIIVPEGIDYSDEEIIKLTDFQEKYFKSEIIRQEMKYGKKRFI